jgi:[calcium/calmodulin-dependent protein kinase] kinase
LPFRGESILELYENIRDQELVIPKGGSPELEDLLRKMLDKNPETRIDVVGFKVRSI